MHMESNQNRMARTCHNVMILTTDTSLILRKTMIAYGLVLSLQFVDTYTVNLAKPQLRLLNKL